MPSKITLFGPDDKSTTIWSPGSQPGPDGCANVYSSLFVDGYFYKECPTGMSSNALYVSYPAGYVSSTISQEDATQAARELLAIAGQELADSTGVCLLGDFQEVFSEVDACMNWDWVADKATEFPRELKNVIPDGTSYGTGEDSGVIVEFPIGNTLSFPLGIAFFYSSANIFLSDLSDDFAPSQALRVDIQDDYGLIHLDLMNFMHDTKPNLHVAAGRDTNENYAINLATVYSLHHTTTYQGKLVADYGSREIYGPAWDPELDGPPDNPFGEPNPNEIPEFTVAELGGFLFRIDTSSRSIINGKLAGVYLVCYKDDIQVYKYNAGLDDYESLYSIPYSPKNKTTYFGCSIIFDGEHTVAEIYIDGQFELSIPDNTLLNIHLPICYSRGFFSVDHWIGDITTGATYPGTNRLPPPVTTRYFEPIEIQRVTAPDPANPGKYFLPPIDMVGEGETELEVNKPFPRLGSGPVEQGFKTDLMNYESQITAIGGGAFFGASCPILTRFDLSGYPEIGKILWGAHALVVGKIEFNRYTEAANAPANPYKYLPTAYGIHPIIPVADFEAGIDWSEYEIFTDFTERYQQHLRYSCSWMGIFQPSEYFTEIFPSQNGGAVFTPPEPSEEETDAEEAGVYEPEQPQTADGWLYVSSMATLFPYYKEDLQTKTDLPNFYYFFEQGWFGSQTFQDVFAGIRTIKFMTGVQGKRTSEVLAGPEYNFKFRCPTPPADPPPINVNIPCVNKEFWMTGTFGPTEGGTHYPFVVDDWKDCLFGDPYNDVCYPSRKTWSNGFNFTPSMQVVFSGGAEVQVQFNPQPPELVHVGARILTKLHTEFKFLDMKVYREDWPGVIYSNRVAINLQTEFNDPPASDVAYSTVQEACYFVPGAAIARYERNELPGEIHLQDFVIIGARYKIVFTLP